MRGEIPVLLGIIAFACLACGKQGQKTDAGEQKETVPPSLAAKITFLELGSVNCIPCRQMQPIIKSVEKKYGDQIRVVFHVVWKDPNVGRQYGIRLIPTQIFLDENDNEAMRHEGFLPEAAIDEFLQSRGLKIVEEKKVK